MDTRDSFDVTVVITSYKRLYNIDALLDCFCNQDFDGSFELILWNNNAETFADLEMLYEKYKGSLHLRLINSTENYYCAMRLVVAHMMHSDYLLVCDDDVRPGAGYIQAFWDKFQQYGPDVVLCARGHLFAPHELDRSEPEKVWKSGKSLVFYDESVNDVNIHFFHADNCFIPRALLLKVDTFDWPKFDFILVDDYWMSYVLSAHLGIPIIKTRLKEHFQFTPCADDKSIALFHNKNVRKERVDFYVYHMERGWPNSIPGQPVAEVTDEDDAISLQTKNAGFFESYDLSVVAYTRTMTGVEDLIESLAMQDFDGTFELVIWNNNYANVGELSVLRDRYSGGLNIKIIHSTEDYSDLPAAALVSLLRGARILVCDKVDTLSNNYLSRVFADDSVAIPRYQLKKSLVRQNNKVRNHEDF